ncbi:Glutamine-dependent NAD synthetase (plasmid) [Borrelia miyamotoi FR64b]|uniref:Glutamine-dependent NAD(+) synthetase n=1 Tax=Borrelia miyamotoi FR64b TaxID=1292392 RepID=W5SIJ0_9SPIR|nr:Glutamine-dependent NAD synthetase [Borrelia miyamotoi FR64b]AHH05625.1 Glutamine-dependent NAD synthetase [Borrelia miyamotoi FR64b]QBK63124.1 NAD(+) synthase [Borrelia miyamotoi]
MLIISFVKVCIVQTKFRFFEYDKILGEFEKIYEYALKNKVDILVFPFIFVGGVEYEHLFHRAEYLRKAFECFDFIKEQVDDRLCVVFGHYSFYEDKLLDCISVVSDHRFIFTTKEVNIPVLFDYKGKSIAVLNLNDELFFQGFEESFNDYFNKSDYLLVPSKSYFTSDKNNLRLKFFKEIAIKNNVEVAYANLYGVFDSIVFDGLSFFINKYGKIKQARKFEDDILLNDGFYDLKLDSEYEILDKLIEALVIALREYAYISRFDKVHLGVSGGIDSALVAYIACVALGAHRVVGISMPSRFSSKGSVSDAKELAKELGFKLIDMPIESMFKSALEFFDGYFNTKGTTKENIQSRLRGLFLMSYSNANNSLLLSTGNKSELAVGYYTLYGDSCGGISLIGDLFKRDVYNLAKYINLKERRAVIPVNIIVKEPSAELKLNQKDSDSLPRYEVLDEILSQYLIENKSLDLLYKSFGKELITKVLDFYSGSEYKRRQSPMIVKVSRKAFGSDIILPIPKVVLTK